MRVLVISTNREMSPQPVAPVGAAWIAEALSQAGFETRLLDLSFEKDPARRVLRALADFSPEGIALSVRNADNGDFLAPRSFLPDVKELTGIIKEHSSARVIIGGPGVSIMPSEILNYLELDWACMGEGEEAVTAFFRAQRPEDVKDFPGIVSRKHPPSGTERKQWINPDTVRPRLHGWVDVKRYLKFEPVLPVQGKRGCANNCLYCTYNRIEGRFWRLREPSVVAGEISELISRTGARTFEFVDSIFNQPEGYMESLLEEIIRRDVKAKFHVSSMSPKGLTKKQVSLMERAGVTAAGITPEAAADETLGSLRKGFTEAEVYKAAEILRESSLKMLWCFLMGGPKEDESTVKKTLKFINGIPAKDKAFLTTGIRIYPHTGMHELALREGAVSSSDSLLMPTFYFTDRL
ncbi:MAG: B12-binding domain-containing radical SAM protein, partial [Nitrospirota bacterium]